MIRLWIDDLRPEPEGWLLALDSATAIAFLASGIQVDEISFDHDLGGDDTTRPVVLWLAEHDAWPSRCYIHTANPVGREWLEGMINHYGPGVSR